MTDQPPHNRIRASSLLPAIIPTTCIRCLSPCAPRNPHTLCAPCKTHLSDPVHAAESFLYTTSLRIYTHFLTLRRRLLADTITAGCDASGTFFEHRVGVPGTRGHVAGVSGVYVPDGEELRWVELGAAGRAMLEEALLGSMQCDNAMILLAGVVAGGMLAEGSPVVDVEEICFRANHACVGTHWCYRATIHDGRVFAVAFADRQLGWLEVVRPWDEYVRERFEPWEMRDAIFYVENSEVVDEEGMRGVEAYRLGSVREAQRRIWVRERLRPWELVRRCVLDEWGPDRELNEEVVIGLQKQFYYSVTVHKEAVRGLWAGVDDEQVREHL